MIIYEKRGYEFRAVFRKTGINQVSMVTRHKQHWTLCFNSYQNANPFEGNGKKTVTSAKRQFFHGCRCYRCCCWSIVLFFMHVLLPLYTALRSGDCIAEIVKCIIFIRAMFRPRRRTLNLRWLAFHLVVFSLACDLCEYLLCLWCPCTRLAHTPMIFPLLWQTYARTFTIIHLRCFYLKLSVRFDQVESLGLAVLGFAWFGFGFPLLLVERRKKSAHFNGVCDCVRRELLFEWSAATNQYINVCMVFSLCTERLYRPLGHYD